MNIATSYSARRVRRLSVTAESRNVRVVHELDGILDDVHPAQLEMTGRALWTTWANRAVPDLLVGLDAGGILPTVAVALASRIPYRLAWKLDLDLPAKSRFTEPHASRTDVFTYGSLTGKQVILVDDEVTTGRTLSNLTTVLRTNGVGVLGVLCLVEDTSGDGRALLDSIDIPLIALTTL